MPAMPLVLDVLGAAMPGIPAMSFLAGTGPADLLAAGLAGFIPGMASISALDVAGLAVEVAAGATFFGAIPGIASISCWDMAAAAGSGVAAASGFFDAGVAFGAMPGMSFMSACAHAVLAWNEVAESMSAVVARAVRAVEVLSFIRGSDQSFRATETTRNMPISMW
jgi:hypothetical protein